MSIHMVVEKCPSQQTHCLKCWRRISLGALRVKRSAYCAQAKYFHLSCYRPGEPRALDFDVHVTLKRVNEDKDVQRVKKWVEKWNSRFIAKEETLPVQFKSKAVETTSSPLRRLLLETFQYLELREIEQVVAFICKEWFHITRDNELWRARYLASFVAANSTGSESYRTQFILQNRGCCWVCHHYISLKSIKLMCPFRKRPLCSECFRTDNGCIVTLHSYFQRRQISLSLIPRLKIRHFTYQKYKQNYLFELANSLLPYAEQRRQALLSALQVAGSVTEDRLAVIRDFDLETYYRSRFGVHGSLPRALGAFCGKDDKFESLEKSIEKFSSHFSRS